MPPSVVRAQKRAAFAAIVFRGGQEYRASRLPRTMVIGSRRDSGESEQRKVERPIPSLAFVVGEPQP